MIGIFIFLWFLLNKTAWGRHVYAIGDDKDAAELSGIRTDRMLVSIYAVAGSSSRNWRLGINWKSGFRIAN